MPSVTRFYRIDEANALVPELRKVVGLLSHQREELVRLRDALVERRRAVEAGGGGSNRPERDPEVRTIELRIRGLVDQMQAGVAWLDQRGIVLRDIPTGLVDFPALVAGRQVWLCWRLGEDRVDWWHELTAGVAGRRPLIELE
jgi:hypothetical protein